MKRLLALAASHALFAVAGFAAGIYMLPILTAPAAPSSTEVAAMAAGADALVVSNHGGRQLEGVSSTVARLPGIADAVGAQGEVYMDGGIRSGVDVVKAVALGADGVLAGRPWVWALAARGERGVADLLAVWRQEIEVTLALMGVRRIAELDRSLIET